jgi:hypothetical protein
LKVYSLSQALGVSNYLICCHPLYRLHLIYSSDFRVPSSILLSQLFINNGGVEGFPSSLVWRHISTRWRISTFEGL